MLDTSFRYTVQKPTLYRARVIAEEMVSLFEEGDVDDIYIIYTRMENAMQTVTEKIKISPLHRFSFAPQNMMSIPAYIRKG